MDISSQASYFETLHEQVSRGLVFRFIIYLGTL